MTIQEILKQFPPKIAQAILKRIVENKTELYYEGVHSLEMYKFKYQSELLYCMDWDEHNRIWGEMYYKLYWKEREKEINNLILAC